MMDILICFNVHREVTLNQETQPFLAKIDENPKAASQPGVISVQSFPIYSIMLALNRTTFDFFSLDVEGSELDVLRTIPWPNVDIKVII
jgi:Methyltransferase FkbM domain